MWVSVFAENQRQIASEWRPSTVGKGNILQRAPYSSEDISPLTFSLLTWPRICMLVPSFWGVANVV